VRYSLDPGPLVDAMQWLAVRAAQWDTKLDDLARYLSADDQPSEDSDGG